VWGRKARVSLEDDGGRNISLKVTDGAPPADEVAVTLEPVPKIAEVQETELAGTSPRPSPGAVRAVSAVGGGRRRAPVPTRSVSGSAGAGAALRSVGRSRRPPRYSDMVF